MGGRFFLLAFLLLKLTALVCKADGEPGLLGGFVMIATSNGSREEDGAPEEAPHTEEQCRGYYDVMGQWDPPFVCKTGDYLYCCGTCGFRFCCSLKHSRLDQSTCKNYDTPVWMKTGQTPYKKMNKMHDSTKDKTNLIVYIICGVVAIMALVGIFTKLGLEKAHRPQRENMSRAVASVLQGRGPGEPFRGEEALGIHSQHFVSRPPALQGSQLNNNVAASSSVGPQHPYPALSQLAQAYEQQQQQQNADLNKYASLKAVAAKYNGEIYNKRRLMVELPTKGGLPLQPMGNSRSAMGNLSMTQPMATNTMSSNPLTSNSLNPSMTQMVSMAPMASMTAMTSMPQMTSLSPMPSITPMTSLGPLTPEPVATYVTEMPSISSVSTLPSERHIAGGSGGLKPNGQKPKGGHAAHSSYSSYSSHTHTHTHTHTHSSKAPGLGASSLAHMVGTMPGGMSRAVETAFGSSSATMGRPFAYSSNTIAGHAAGFGIKGWDGTETVGRRKSYGHKRPQCTVLEPNQLHGTRGQSHSQHFLPTQPYFVTNSKTEVTV
ncbi:protein shisa-9A isoform X1 [Xiphophorus couchianus]|uniref:protein shisa-9A isoform X1 n=1 Tax=Xiphophorus couchianus TaxID=32473 RepID=UPI001015E81A|nr:protein shisa-9 isoform X1 [Xiphophorus couchianus]